MYFCSFNSDFTQYAHLQSFSKNGCHWFFLTLNPWPSSSTTFGPKACCKRTPMRCSLGDVWFFSVFCGCWLETNLKNKSFVVFCGPWGILFLTGIVRYILYIVFWIGRFCWKEFKVCLVVCLPFARYTYSIHKMIHPEELHKWKPETD